MPCGWRWSGRSSTVATTPSRVADSTCRPTRSAQVPRCISLMAAAASPVLTGETLARPSLSGCGRRPLRDGQRHEVLARARGPRLDRRRRRPRLALVVVEPPGARAVRRARSLPVAFRDQHLVEHAEDGGRAFGRRPSQRDVPALPRPLVLLDDPRALEVAQVDVRNQAIGEARADELA